jgi:hypothetical protein
MYLFVNNIITDNRNTGPNRFDRLDIFKYSLASLACIDIITHAIIYAELDGSYSGRESELRTFLDEIFPNAKVEYYNSSPSNQTEWRKVLENSPVLEKDAITFYDGNDDHIFLDYELAGLYEGIELLKKEPQEQINTIHISSWPEAISTLYYGTVSGGPREEPSKLYWSYHNYCEIAMQVVNSTFFKHIFLESVFGDTFARRTDTMFSGWGGYKYPTTTPHPPIKMFVPLREMMRHFEAYWHVGVSEDICPRLIVPNGFFKKDIKINYCAPRKEGFYNMNPVSSDGDDKKMLEDIPLFWKGRVSEILDYSNLYSREAVLAGRNNAHRALITVPHDRHWQGQSYGGILPLDEKYIQIGYRND